MLRVMDAPGFYAAFPWGGYKLNGGPGESTVKLINLTLWPLL